LGLRSDHYSIAWTTQSGDLGENQGVGASLSHDFAEHWRMGLSGGYNSYLVQLKQPDRLAAWYGLARITRRMGHGLELDAEGQFLRNAVSDHDVRVLVRITKLLFLGEDSE
jgi:hypothetical protein